MELSQALLGQYLCTRIDDQYTVGRIVETEAYRAPEDKASHAYGNRRTARTEIMFQEGGLAYVYLCYGIHYLFNIVSGPKEAAQAVLVRALEPVEGIEWMKQRRGERIPVKQLTNGPGKLSQALGISLKQNKAKLYESAHPEIWVAAGDPVPPDQIIKSKRVGVDYAEEWKEKLWRFYISGHQDVSVK